MKFLITTTRSNDNITVLNDYPCLIDYNYALEAFTKVRKIRIKDENGNPMYQEISETILEPVIHISDMKELIEFIDRVEAPIIISHDKALPEIEIYDGYIE